MAKMSNKMIALCSAAVGAIYMTGFVITEPEQSQTTTHHQERTVNQDKRVVKESKNQNAKTPSTSKIYKDGTFYGTGINNIGSVEVAVTIKDDKITSVEITKCETQYPESEISHLPQQVLARQSSKIDIVSGATLSSEDFQSAVADALQQAKI
ncbi:FMN-binding protein [Bacillus smithii]|uniref:FMN-binding protein n=1 Tax=Bacillus smithii TaxID=1479 RepID=UPI003D1DDF63